MAGGDLYNLGETAYGHDVMVETAAKIQSPQRLNRIQM